MKLFIALGNPEPEYESTRHNVGKDFLNFWHTYEFGFHQWVYDKYTNCDVIKVNDDLIIAKTRGYMNEVGDTVKKAVKQYNVGLDELYIVYDELDLFVGEYKLAFQKGSRIHNGILSVNESLKDDAYWHLRIGTRDLSIPASIQKSGRDPKQYVLQRYSSSDKNTLEQMYEHKIIKAISQ